MMTMNQIRRMITYIHTHTQTHGSVNLNDDDDHHHLPMRTCDSIYLSLICFFFFILSFFCSYSSVDIAHHSNYLQIGILVQPNQSKVKLSLARCKFNYILKLNSRFYGILSFTKIIESLNATKNDWKNMKKNLIDQSKLKIKSDKYSQEREREGIYHTKCEIICHN